MSFHLFVVHFKLFPSFLVVEYTLSTNTMGVGGGETGLDIQLKSLVSFPWAKMVPLVVLIIPSSIHIVSFN